MCGGEARLIQGFSRLGIHMYAGNLVALRVIQNKRGISSFDWSIKK
jgi:hypothetical protein